VVDEFEREDEDGDGDGNEGEGEGEFEVDDEIDEREFHREWRSGEAMRSREEAKHDEESRLDKRMEDFLGGPSDADEGEYQT
jgi:hypothetical protein